MKSVVIRTSDIQKSIAFYEKILGFTFDSMISPSPGKQIAFLSEPDTNCTIELLHNDNANPVPGNSVSLTFVVEQIGEAEKFLTANKVHIISAPKTIKDGKKIMTAVDPNGIELDFIEE
ncbi:VOC family protein [Brucepastera parasyntrophica]|uniref:VOC family protein n=1 Tax=Brucepastera parasyntrophica TaxID=2880008 RepID=UPI00210C0ACB|nr:VOC family protein [Brucepastera parasyntrophica]ULQ60839.1 VOC family protein [Brucepastera parasyntrophica]